MARALFVNNLKLLNTDEHLGILRLLRKNAVSYTENSNGIFFPMSIIKAELFEEMNNYVEFCLNNRGMLQERDIELQKYQDEHDSTINLPAPIPPATTLALPPDTRDAEMEKYKSTLKEQAPQAAFVLIPQNE